MANARDVGCDFKTVGKAHTGNFTNSGVRLLGSLGSDFGSHTALERRVEVGRTVLKSIEPARQSNRLDFATELLPLPLDELIDGRH